MDSKKLGKFLDTMKSNGVHNYVVPGLSSYMLGDNGDSGKVRLFESSRERAGEIVPHSHRFDFRCLVLSGVVENVIWHPKANFNKNSDTFYKMRNVYAGDFGQFTGGQQEEDRASIGNWASTSNVYTEGDWYGMPYNQIHSIYFSRGARVLFFEGPQLTEESVMLLPFVDGKIVNTGKVLPWMFQKEESE